MAPLMQLEEEDILESSLLAFTDDESMASPTPVEEATILDDDPGPQEAQATSPRPECSAQSKGDGSGLPCSAKSITHHCPHGSNYNP